MQWFFGRQVRLTYVCKFASLMFVKLRHAERDLLNIHDIGLLGIDLLNFRDRSNIRIGSIIAGHGSVDRFP